MRAAVKLRADYTAGHLRVLARRSSDAGQTRRLLALAVIYEGGSRGEAAKTGNVGRQIIRDWVLAFNADGPDNAMCGRVICLGDGGSVGGIVLLAALDIGFDARRWDQSDLMAQLNQPTRPMMSYRAGFHADQTRRQSCKELFHSRSSELFAHDHPAGLIAPWT